MDSIVYRLYVEKKEGFDIEKNQIFEDFKKNLKIKNLENLRIFNRYDVSKIEKNDFSDSIYKVFAERNQDHTYLEKPKTTKFTFGVEYLPGQFDQRSDSAAQCIQIITGKEKPIVKYAKIIALEGDIKKEDFIKIKNYYINPVDSREASLGKPLTLEEVYTEQPEISIFDDFIYKKKEDLKKLIKNHGFAMEIEDIILCQEYFKKENRNPTETELKVIDTYWSDHCRHTTFSTKINNVQFKEGKISNRIKATYNSYLEGRKSVYEDKEKDITLMDIATLSMKELRKIGKLDDLEISDEINACSIIVKVDVDEKKEDWLIMFKNETHNHPTEIEPFGGAATCLGGAIRDPLSGRSYVYQAMRVTGSGNPKEDIDKTLEGKLPQIKITKEAARGFSSYGNQIGLATGQVKEYYDERFIAKRMEVGAVIAAAPKENVIRNKPKEGDLILLVGGKTGRDGCGGATGSSKVHTEDSIIECGSEVQKGNPPEERKIQRLFRNPKVSKLIKKCNDFGAGGVAVAVGELAEGLYINLDKVSKKYEGLNATELAISESQERMAVVIDKDDLQTFKKLAQEENIECNIIAKVTDEKRLIMTWKDKEILNISRKFLDSNGAKQETEIIVSEPNSRSYFDSFKTDKDFKSELIRFMSQLNISSQKGLSEMFDSTVGAASVLMPYGGKYQLTPVDGMVSKIPLEKGDTNTCTIMTHGYDPQLAVWSPYHGGMYAVISSLSKIVALGGDYKKVRLSLQEYFESLGKDPEKWAKPFTALLGAYDVQKQLDIPAIGGKDSMSGTFKDLNVPPSLISFAVGIGRVEDIISPEFKKSKSKVIRVPINLKEDYTPNFEDLKIKYDEIYKQIKNNNILSASSVGYGGVATAIAKMSFGNKIGFRFKDEVDLDNLFKPSYGDIILEVKDLNNISNIEYEILGETISEDTIYTSNDEILLEELITLWEEGLNDVFKIKEDKIGEIKEVKFENKNKKIKTNFNHIKRFKPRVFIPVFPGTNCEYDTIKAFEEAGGEVKFQVFKNLTPKAVENSIKNMTLNIRDSNIIALPGGFSAGDEPEGSGKFITSVFRNPYISQELMSLLTKRDGLIIGICNGFQALIKLGLIQYGEIREIEEDYPTLTFNKIGRHISKIVKTKITSDLSPWFNNTKLGEIHHIPVSHGEGRFVANEKWLKKLEKNGQISTQYVDENNNPTYNGNYNPNGSIWAVESITSPDGRILGKMGHSERIGQGLYKNIYGEKDQKLFKSSIDYFKL